ncbi:MAG: mitochondrial fission ELM1 family protein [Porticoccaceae bacterium]
MTAPQADPGVWVLLGQKAGDNHQVLALAEALGWPFTCKQIVNRPWELLTNRCAGTTLAGIDRRRSSELRPPWPELVISAGRRNEPVARWLKKRSAGRARLVHIGRPWAPLTAFDLIVTTPQYFLPAAANILHNRLPMHRIDRDRVRTEAAALAPHLGGLKPPYTAVLLGGDSGPFVFTPAKARRLALQVNTLIATVGGSVLVTDSRRTPADAAAAFWSALRAPAWRHDWRDGTRPNPYRAYLGLADRFVLTGESMSMLAEAVAMGKPVHLFAMDDPGHWWRGTHNWRFKPLSHRLAMALGPRRMRRDVARIQRDLVTRGLACWLGAPLSGEPVRADIAPGADLARAAERVRALFAG